MTGVHSKVATIMKETESGIWCGRRTMYVSCRFIASGSISVMRYNNNNNHPGRTTSLHRIPDYTSQSAQKTKKQQPDNTKYYSIQSTIETTLSSTQMVVNYRVEELEQELL